MSQLQFVLLGLPPEIGGRYPAECSLQYMVYTYTFTVHYFEKTVEQEPL